MKQRQRIPVRVLVMVVAVFVATTTACSGAGSQTQARLGAADDVVKALSRVTDDAARQITGRGQAPELNRLSGELDDLLKRAPQGSSLSAVDKAAVQRAAQQAALAREIAKALGVADEITALITKDSVELVKGFRHSWTNRLTPARYQRLEASAQSVLKDTTCQLFLDAMPTRVGPSPSPLAQATLPSYLPPARPTFQDVYTKLKTTMEKADAALSTATLYVNLYGLTSALLSKSSGYVSKAKNSMTATSWENAGALRLYMQICVFTK